MSGAIGLGPTQPFAPRPLWTSALCRYRLGTLAGPRRYRLIGQPEWYRQARRRRPTLAQFRASEEAPDDIGACDTSMRHGDRQVTVTDLESVTAAPSP